MSRVLVIDEQAKENIANLTRYANENRISKPFMMAAINGKIAPIGDNPQHCCHLANGFKVVLSIEEQPQGWSKHLSVSVDSKKPKAIPSIAAVECILQEFGMKPLADSVVYIEDKIIPNAINVISKI